MVDGASSNAEFPTVDGLPNRTRSGSASNGHRRSLSGSLLSRLSFLRISQASAQSGTKSHAMEQDGDNEGFSPAMHMSSEATTGARAMSAVIQQQRKTRRRRGSLRKTALLGTRLEMREKRAASKSADATTPRYMGETPRSPKDQTSSAANGFGSHESLEYDAEDTQPSWFRASTAQKTIRSSGARRRQGLAPHNLLGGEETGTDDEELVSFPRINATNNTSTSTGSPKITPATALHISTQSDYSTYPLPGDLPTDTPYRTVHRKSSPLATHSVEIKSNADTWDYSETEWWGWIILIVTWLVFVVGMGSCFEVWSWAWDVGETPYAPPELEDDPTLPIVGYYPALIILTGVMSWVWVVVAWVGMKYFKHANISGDDS
ncbi:hypothetical protein PMG11_03611 [Penicillium brasilianum]|uniref:Uncharacterized protein n=1 Tax=Penicillium brasilianum TaxID=104259 RepID=A0A0F7VAK1_PENBI|nr:hypothetical protein PMG11_03611 [Penicillium brasilianum]